MLSDKYRAPKSTPAVKKKRFKASLKSKKPHRFLHPSSARDIAYIKLWKSFFYKNKIKSSVIFCGCNPDKNNKNVCPLILNSLKLTLKLK